MPPARGTGGRRRIRVKADPRLRLSREQREGMAGLQGRTEENARPRRPLRNVPTPTMLPVRPAPDRPSRPQTFSESLEPSKRRPPVRVPFREMAPEEFAVGERNLTKERRAEIDRFNQQQERTRRAEARAQRASLKAARDERRGQLKGMTPLEKRAFLTNQGNRTARDFVEHGPRGQGPTPLDVARGLVGGVADLVGEQTGRFTTRLSAGASGRRAGLPEEYTAEDSLLARGAGDLLLGPNVVALMRGEDFDPRWAGVEAALALVPIKGLPTPITAALRAAMGGKAFTRALRGGKTFGEAVQELQTPVRARKAANVAKRRSEGTTSSSFVAGAVGDALARAGAPRGVVNLVRNSPLEERVFRYGDSVVTRTAAKSRIGKLSERAVDRVRPALSGWFDVRGKAVGPLKTERDKYMQQLGRNIQFSSRAATNALVDLDSALSRGVGKKFRNVGRRIEGLNIPELYALRMVGRQTHPGVMFNEHMAAAAAAEAAGRLDQAANHRFHAAMVNVASSLVEKRGSQIEFASSASGDIRNVYKAMQGAAESRERVIRDLELLTDETINERIFKEELWYHGARWQKTEDYFQTVLEESPNRQALHAILSDRDPQLADGAIQGLDALARQAHEVETSNVRQALEKARANRLAEPNNPQWVVDEQVLASELRRGVDPDVVYRKISAVVDGFDDETVDLIRAEWGDDVVASIQDIGNPFDFPANVVRANQTRRAKVNAGEIVFDHRNDRVLDRNGIPLVGPITFEERARRMLLATPDQATRLHDSRFYNEVEPLFAKVYNDQEIMAWLTSQVGASPARGVHDLQRVLEATRLGREIPTTGPGSIGLAARTMQKLLKGETGLSEGAKAKISDFVDSALHRTTRTWMGHDLAYGRPFVSDRWSGRAEGLVDRDGIRQLQRLFDQNGIDMRADDLNLDLVTRNRQTGDLNPAAGLNQNQYELIAKSGEDFTDYLNSVGFDGRTDWEPYEIQAMEWAGIQRYWGDEPEDITFALALNTQMLSFEVTRGPGALGERLTDAQAARVARALEDDVRRLVETEPNVRFHQIRYDVSGWAGGTNASVHLHLVTHDGDAAVRAATKVARAFDQELVQATRRTTSGKAQRSLTFAHPGLKSTAAKKRFMKALYDEIPEFRPHGWMADDVRGDPAITLITSLGKKTGDDLRVWGESYEAAVSRAAQRAKLADVDYTVGNHQIRVGSQYGETELATEFGTVGGVARADLEDPLEAEVRGRLEETIRRLEDGEDLGVRASIDAGDAAGEAAGSGRVLDPWDDAVHPRDYSRGQKLVMRSEGYREATDTIRRGKLPASFLRRVVADTRYSDYDKVAIVKFLDDVSGGQIVANRDRLNRLVPGLRQYAWKEMRLRGLFEGGSRKLSLGEGARVDTAFEEFVHAVDAFGGFPEEFLTDVRAFLGVTDPDVWTKQNAEDLVDILRAGVLGLKRDAFALEGIPPHLQEGMMSLREGLQRELLRVGGDTRGSRMLNRLEKTPEGEQLLEAARNLFFYRHYGDEFGLHGARPTFASQARFYMPESLALPASFHQRDWFHRRVYSHMRGLGGKTALRESDKRLSNEFRGHLLDTGAFDKDVVRGTISTQIKAARLWAMSRLKAKALEFATDAPVFPDDIAVVAGARLPTGSSKRVGVVQELLRSLDEGEMITGARMDAVDFAHLEEAMGSLFYGTTKQTEDAAARLASDMLSGVQEPIEGLVWVRRRDLVDTGLFDLPVARGIGTGTADAVNDVLKAMVLVAKPSYIPMNLTGNTVMALIQQGFSAPMNLTRAILLSRKLGQKTALIDWHAGSGHIAAVYGRRGHVPGVSEALDAVTQASGFAVDRFWRRAAFIHEASKFGYFTDQQLLDLVENARHIDDLRAVSTRTREALVDFENLSQWEKDYASRILFVYPWFKGATYWTGRFPKDHPVQAAAFATLLAWQQDRLRDEFPDGFPSYMKWYLPLGETERNGKTMPYGFRMDQALTPLSGIDMALDAARMFGLDQGGFGEEEAFGSRLNPLWEAIVAWSAGADPFTGRPVDRDLLSFLKLLNPLEASVFKMQLEKALRDDATRRANPGLYAPTKTEDWLKLFFGSLAPGVVDPKKAAERAGGANPSAEDRLNAWKAKAAQVMGEEPPDQFVEWKRNQQLYNETRSDYTRERGADDGGLTTQESLVAHLRFVLRARGSDQTINEDAVLALSDAEAQAMIDDIKRDFGLTQIGRLDRHLGERAQEVRVGG